VLQCVEKFLKPQGPSFQNTTFGCNEAKLSESSTKDHCENDNDDDDASNADSAASPWTPCLDNL